MIDVFLSREDAETTLADILRDEPEFADILHIEPIKIGEPVMLVELGGSVSPDSAS